MIKKGYISFGKFSIEEVLSKITKTKREKMVFIDNSGKEHEVKMNSMRYKTFKNSGTKCVKCGLEGRYFKLERPYNSEYDTCHFNLYGINKDGEEVMLTKDHIIPKSKGGTNFLNNMQTMCHCCNGKKSDRPNEEFMK